jgi:hypothetical protein
LQFGVSAALAASGAENLALNGFFVMVLVVLLTMFGAMVFTECVLRFNFGDW